MRRLEPEILRELLACDPVKGRLYWLNRDRRWFQHDGAWRS